MSARGLVSSPSCPEVCLAVGWPCRAPRDGPGASRGGRKDHHHLGVGLPPLKAMKDMTKDEKNELRRQIRELLRETANGRRLQRLDAIPASAWMQVGRPDLAERRRGQ